MDHGKDNKDMLRTNPSEDDLCLKEFVDPIICHRDERSVKPIMKVWGQAFQFPKNSNNNENSSSDPYYEETALIEPD